MTLLPRREASLKQVAPLLAALLASAGCGEGAIDLPNDPEIDGTSIESALDEAEPTSDRGGVGVAAADAEEPSVAAATIIDPRKSLILTEPAALSGFTLKAVMDQLVTQSGVAGLTSLQLFRQWWDTQNTAPGLGLGAHCNDQIVNGAPALNGFPHVCPRAEGSQASSDPFSNPTADAAYLPIAVVNRFDLAPTTGAHCGEYRVVFARRSGLLNGQRNFLIFEAVLPNPRTDLGIQGCRPVLNFWASLSTKTLAERGPLLRSFYFTGLTGFSPVIHIDNYGNSTTRPTGQVRTNQFMTFNWNLREFKVKKICDAATGTCALRFVPATDKTNPFADLFRPSSTQPLKAEFQGTGTTSFFASVQSLAVNNINTFNYRPSDKFNAGESDAQSSSSLYTAAFGTSASAFRTNIQSKLTAIGSTLTPDHIVARAQALSCAGCHQLSNEADLGGGLRWPSSLGFVHVSEFSEAGPEGNRFRISGALTGTFLPRRKVVFESTLNRAVRNSTFVSQTVPTSVLRGQVFTVTVAFKNAGTTAWTEQNQFRLASEAPADNIRWGKNRVTLAPTDKVHFNQTKTFTFTVTAPATAGTFVFQWRMIDDPGTRFGALSTPVNITVR